VAAGLRRNGRAEQAATIKNTRWALLRNPESLSLDQRSTLAAIQATNGPLYRAWLLKEQLRAGVPGPRSGRRDEAAHRLGSPRPSVLAWTRSPSSPKRSKSASS